MLCSATVSCALCYAMLCSAMLSPHPAWPGSAHLAPRARAGDCSPPKSRARRGQFCLRDIDSWANDSFTGRLADHIDHGDLIILVHVAARGLPNLGHPYYWEGQREALDVERAVARGLGPAAGLHIRNAGAMHVLHGNTVKAPLPGSADYEERLRAMDGLAGFFVYLLLTIA